MRNLSAVYRVGDVQSPAPHSSREVPPNRESQCEQGDQDRQAESKSLPFPLRTHPHAVCSRRVHARSIVDDAGHPVLAAVLLRQDLPGVLHIELVQDVLNSVGVEWYGDDGIPLRHHTLPHSEVRGDLPQGIFPPRISSIQGELH